MSHSTGTAMLVVNSRLKIPMKEFQFTYSRSSGPGGQNVNKLNTKALLRWPVMSSPSLPETVRKRLIGKHRRRVTSDGDFLVVSQRYRDAGRNTADCLEKLRAMLAEAAAPPPPKRKPTKPTRGAVRRRLDSKRRNSQKKQQRRAKFDD